MLCIILYLPTINITDITIYSKKQTENCEYLNKTISLIVCLIRNYNKLNQN